LRQHGRDLGEQPVAHVVGKLGIFGEHHLAVGLHHRHMAARHDPAGGAVEHHAVGRHHLIALPSLHMAARHHDIVVAVVIQLVGDEADRLGFVAGLGGLAGLWLVGVGFGK
jgi:hypothetical protein